MRSRPFAVLLAAMAVAVSGCFTEPVATGERLPLDEKRIGRWLCTSAESPDEKAELTVLRFDDAQYFAEWKESESKADRYRAYGVKLRGVVVLNVQDLGSTKTSWTAVRTAFEKDGAMAIQAPARKILDMDDEKAALRELRASADSPSAWQPFARCTREPR